MTVVRALKGFPRLGRPLVPPAGGVRLNFMYCEQPDIFVRHVVDFLKRNA